MCLSHAVTAYIYPHVFAHTNPNKWHIFKSSFFNSCLRANILFNPFPVTGYCSFSSVFKRKEQKQRTLLGFMIFFIWLILTFTVFFKFSGSFSFTWQVIKKNMYMTFKPLSKKTGREKHLALRWQGLQGRMVRWCELLGVLFVYVVSFLGFWVSLPICVPWQPTALPQLSCGQRQTECRGMETVAKFPNSQESFNSKMGLVPILWKIVWNHVILNILLSMYLGHRE